MTQKSEEKFWKTVMIVKLVLLMVIIVCNIIAIVR